MVLYPSSTLHRVEPIAQGVRLVAVAWVQSLVKDPAERELLFDLDTARQAIFAKDGKTAEFDLISKSHANLLRKWGEI
jgi:PKHD-type hydroxylase